MDDVTCQRFASYEDLRAAGYPVGGFAWAETYDAETAANLLVCVPGDFQGEDDSMPLRLRSIPVYREGGPAPARTAWSWNGDEDSPTIRPSLGCWGRDRADGYVWHGFLTDGVLRSV